MVLVKNYWYHFLYRKISLSQKYFYKKILKYKYIYDIFISVIFLVFYTYISKIHIYVQILTINNKITKNI